jgi:hypothetical protein
MNINNRYTSDNGDNEPETLPEDIFGEDNEDDRPQRQLQAFELIQEVQDLTTHLRKLTVMNFMFPTWKAIEEIKYLNLCLNQAHLYLGEIVKKKRPYIRKLSPEN